MAKNKKIKVTPNVQKCLEILVDVVKDMPSSDLKTKAQGAIDYLDRTFKGEPQPNKGRNCPQATLIIRK
jgi:hypothetical protein